MSVLLTFHMLLPIRQSKTLLDVANYEMGHLKEGTHYTCIHGKSRKVSKAHYVFHQSQAMLR